MSSIDVNRQLSSLVSHAVIGVVNQVCHEVSRNDCYCELENDIFSGQKNLVFKQVGYCEWLCVNVYRLLFVWCPFLQCLISPTVERCRAIFKKTIKEIQTNPSITLDQLERSLEKAASIPRLAKVKSVFQQHSKNVKFMKEEVQYFRNQIKEAQASVAQLNKQLAEAQKSRDSNDEKIKQASSNAGRAAPANAQNRNADLQNEKAAIEALNAQLAQKTTLISNLEAQLKRLQAQNKENHQELIKELTLLKEGHTQLKKKHEEDERLKEVIIADCQKKLEEEHQRSLALIKQSQDDQAALSSLQAQHLTLTTAHAALETVHKQREQLVDLGTRIAEFQQIKQLHAGGVKTHADFKAVNDDLVKERNQLTSKLNEALKAQDTERNKLQKQIISLQGDLVLKNQEIKLKEEEVKSRITQAQSQQLELHARMKALEAERDAANKQRDNAQAALVQGSDKAQAEMLKQLQEAQQELKAKEEANLELIRQLKDAEVSKTKLREQLQIEKETTIEAKLKFRVLDYTHQELSEMQAKTMAQLKALRSELETEREQKYAMQTELQKLKEDSEYQIGDLTGTNEALKHDFEEHAKASQEELKKAEERRSELEKELAQQTELYQGSMKLVVDLQSSLAKQRGEHLESVAKVSHELRRQSDASTETFDAVKASAERLTNEVARLEEEIQAKEARIKKLEMDLHAAQQVKSEQQIEVGVSAASDTIRGTLLHSGSALGATNGSASSAMARPAVPAASPAPLSSVPLTSPFTTPVRSSSHAHTTGAGNGVTTHTGSAKGKYKPQKKHRNLIGGALPSARKGLFMSPTRAESEAKRKFIQSEVQRQSKGIDESLKKQHDQKDATSAATAKEASADKVNSEESTKPKADLRRQKKLIRGVARAVLKESSPRRAHAEKALAGEKSPRRTRSTNHFDRKFNILPTRESSKTFNASPALLSAKKQRESQSAAAAAAVSSAAPSDDKKAKNKEDGKT